MPRRSPLELLLPVVVVLTILPLGFATYYARTWATERAGKDVVEQRATLKGVPWFKPEFRKLVAGLNEALPEDARILVEPSSLDDNMKRLTGKSRWFLYLDYYLYPRRVYVRQPKLGSGTLVDYKPWIRHHTVTLDLDGSGGQDLGAVIQRERTVADETAAILERDIRWKLTYPVSEGIRIDRLRLYERDPASEDELVWVERDLRAFLGLAPKGAGPADGGGDGGQRP